jgi:hypothetical protein
MSATLPLHRPALVLLLLAATSGCDQEPAAQPVKTAEAPAKAAPAGGAAKRVQVGKNVAVEIQPDGKRRVLVSATVCLREGQLELFLTRRRTKEHEAILAAELDARDIHKALLVAGAEAGRPVKYVEKDGKYSVVPPTGTRVKVSVQYEDKGKTVTVPAQKWVRSTKSKKDLESDWVFAGSLLIEDLDDKSKPPLYAANGGDVICISNFESALLDLPFQSSKENPELMFEANPDRIPPLETRVTAILEPQAEKKK